MSLGDFQLVIHISEAKTENHLETEVHLVCQGLVLYFYNINEIHNKLL